ncbi:MAG: hypothetical protein HY361_03290 [Candidatus Aenigmarchaeota archaeon]|nr:hypothetical protein [Candidatus Aenigmarchaeota archaeon]
MYNITINELLQFGLKKNHIKLLNFFLPNIGKDLTAKEVSKNVDIPVSRIYIYLNDLVKLKLIDRKFHSRALFSLTEPETRFRDFLRRKDVEAKEVHKSILDSLRTIAAQNFVIIRSSEEFYETAYHMVKDIKAVKILSHSPLLLFVNERLGEWGGQLLDMYKKRIDAKEIDFSYVFDKNFLKDKNLRENKDVVAKNVEWLNTHENVKLGAVDARNILTMVITEKEVLIGFSAPEERKVIRGLLSRSNEMVHFFDRVYDEVFSRAEKVDVNAVLKNM